MICRRKRKNNDKMTVIDLRSKAGGFQTFVIGFFPFSQNATVYVRSTKLTSETENRMKHEDMDDRRKLYSCQQCLNMETAMISRKAYRQYIITVEVQNDHCARTAKSHLYSTQYLNYVCCSGVLHRNLWKVILHVYTLVSATGLFY
jgi:hypothetical protein